MAKKTLIAYGECYYGLVALLEKENQKYWKSANEGGPKKIWFRSSDDEEEDKKELMISIGEINSLKEKEIIEYFKKLNVEDSLSINIQQNNTWDSLIEELGREEEDFLQYPFGSGKNHCDSYIFSTYQGDYTAYLTKSGIDCWSGYESREKEIVRKEKKHTIEIEQDGEYILGAADKIEYNRLDPFEMKKGVYDVEIGYDKDNGPILFRLKRR